MKKLLREKSVTIRLTAEEFHAYTKAAERLMLRGGISQLFRLATADFIMNTFRGEV